MSTATASCNIADIFACTAAQFPDLPAVIHQRNGASWSFAELQAESNRCANGLKSAGIDRGTRVMVMIKPGVDFVAIVYGLLKLGALPVMMDPGMGLSRLLGCVRQVQPQAFIGIPKAQALRIFCAKAFKSVECAITVGHRWCWGGPTMQQLRRQASARFEMARFAGHEPAAILFTSGSTGPAKGVVYEHGMFAAQLRSIQAHYDMKPGEIELATFPLFALFCPAMGMTCVFPEMDYAHPSKVDPARIVEAVRDYAVTNAFGSPALWDPVSSYCVARGITLPTVRRILIAGAPVDWRIVQRLRQCLAADAAVYTPYGATESLPVSSAESREILGDCLPATRHGGGICVGRPVANRAVRIIQISDQPIEQWSEDLVLPTGDIGEIVVAGDVVTRCYHDLPEATRRAKIKDGERLWHRLGDVGYFDTHGRLWYCGRKSHRVETTEGPLFSECCEAIFKEHPQVSRAALVGLDRPGGQRPVIVVEPEAGRLPDGQHKEDCTRELLALGQRHPTTRAIREILYHRQFPVDARHNAKIDRQALATWAEGQLK